MVTVRHLYVALVLSVLAVLAPATTATAAEQSVTLSGRFLLPEGVDPTTVRVLAQRWREDTQTWHTASRASTTLDDEATWALTDLVPGEYRITVSQPNGTIAERYSFPREGGRTSSITLAPGEVREGLEFTVPLGATLAGTVAVPEGVEPTHLWVTTHERLDDGTFAASGRTVRVQPDGTWAATQLFPGTYRVQVTHDDDATWPTFHGGPDLASAHDVIVDPGGSRPGVDLAPARSGGLTGRVQMTEEVEGLHPSECLTVSVWQRQGTTWSSVASAKVSPSGAWAVRGLRSGSFRVGFADDACARWSTETLVATQFHPAALAVAHAQDITVTDGADRAVGTTSLSPRTRLMGRLWIADLDARSVATNRLVQVHRRTGAGWQVVAEQRTDAGGEYHFSDLPTGEYRIGFARGDRQVVPLFYPASLTLAGARTIVARPASEGQFPYLDDVATWLRGTKVTVLQKPRVRGKARVGRHLRVTRGKYVQNGVTLRRQWQVKRHGKVRPLKGAVGQRLKVRPRHSGAKVRVRIVVTAPGHARRVVRTRWSAPVRRR